MNLCEVALNDTYPADVYALIVTQVQLTFGKGVIHMLQYCTTVVVKPCHNQFTVLKYLYQYALGGILMGNEFITYISVVSRNEHQNNVAKVAIELASWHQPSDLHPFISISCF